MSILEPSLRAARLPNKAQSQLLGRIRAQEGLLGSYVGLVGSLPVPQPGLGRVWGHDRQDSANITENTGSSGVHVSPLPKGSVKQYGVHIGLREGNISYLSGLHFCNIRWCQILVEPGDQWIHFEHGVCT